MNDKLEKLDVSAPQPYLRKGEVADNFKALRGEILQKSGWDFLAIFGDMFRDKSYTAINNGSVTRSPHKCGVAFDYNQGFLHLALVRENDNGQIWWRTYIICKNQDGSQGQKLKLKTDNVGTIELYVVDFTAIAERYGFGRIHAKSNFAKFWSRREFWHYEYKKLMAKGYDALMNDLYGKGGWKY